MTSNPPEDGAPPPLGAIGLSTRTLNALTESAVWTVDDLTARTAAELSHFPRIGAAGIAQIRARLAAHGLALRGELRRR